jgi:hypothetical protein
MRRQDAATMAYEWHEDERGELVATPEEASDE